jgi:uncharacterized membrane protein YeaQ/YmgE (transglycosylase-associated protein family)
MGLIYMLVVGGLLGWVASMIMRTDGQQGVFLNIVIGIVGAVLSGYFVTPFLGGSPITTGSFDMKSLVVSLLGALILLAVINLIRRGSVR